MNPLVRKEIRMLLPAWIGAVVVATMLIWIGPQFRGFVPGLFCVAILALALSPFGLETTYGTFGLLLVQPENRLRLWRIKINLLALALASAGGIFVLCALLSSFPIPPETNYVSDFFKYGGLGLLLVFSGGLWSTLLLRDMVSAFFCALITPWGIVAVTALITSHWINFDKESEAARFQNIVFGALVVYAIAGFVWARRLFLRAQDVGWTGGQISLTSVRGISLRWLAFEFKGPQNPWTALVKKELQLQEITMFLVPALFVLYLACLALCHLAPHRVPKELLVVIPSIWLAAVPFVIGCVAVAEERRLNTLESQLCLPVTKRGQFTVKFATALVLGIVLGGLIPGALLTHTHNFPKDFKLQYLIEIAAAITGIAFYASSMSRGLLQALPITVCIPALAGMVGAIFAKLIDQSDGRYELAFVGSSWYAALLLPAMVITLTWLAFNNYKRLQIGWRVWMGDTIKAGAIFGCATLTAFSIFDRAWELFLPLEPNHGPARISGPGRPAIVVSHKGAYVLLPDGRLWIGNNLWTGSAKHNTLRLRGLSGNFANISNWLEIATDGPDAAGIQTDGTLWKIHGKSDISQVGSDADWKGITGGGGTFLAVKQDGTLWGWGYDGDEILTENTNITRKTPPVASPIRVGNESDWVNAFISGANSHAIAVKRDGTVWKWGVIYRSSRQETISVRQKIRENIDGTDWVAITEWWDSILGLRSDGTLWVAGEHFPANAFGETFRHEASPKPVHFGTKSDWVSLSGSWANAALEADGKLWASQGHQTVRPSKYHDWLAATQSFNGTWALAKDGTLTGWDEFNIDWPNESDFWKRFFLGPTRRPLFTTNILSQ